jgi:hypothetical protein
VKLRGRGTSTRLQEGPPALVMIPSKRPKSRNKVLVNTEDERIFRLCPSTRSPSPETIRTQHRT